MLPEIAVLSTIVYCSGFQVMGRKRSLLTRKSQHTLGTGLNSTFKRNTQHSQVFPAGQEGERSQGGASPYQWSTVPQPSAVLSSLWISSLLGTDSGFYLHTSSTSELSRTSASPSHPAGKLEQSQHYRAGRGLAPICISRLCKPVCGKRSHCTKALRCCCCTAQLHTVLPHSCRSFRFPWY